MEGMPREMLLSGFLLTREDWETLDEDTRNLFTQMLAEEGRAPRFYENAGRYRYKRAAPTEPRGN